MKLKLTRRRFGQLAIASTATVALGYLANKTLAQTPTTLLYGVRAGAVPRGLLVQSLDLTTGVIVNLSQLTSAVTLLPAEPLVGFSALLDGTLVLATASVSTETNDVSKDKVNPSRVIFLGTSPKTLSVSGLKKEDTLDTLLTTNDGSLYSLVIGKNGRPPVTLVSINRSTGQITKSDKINLPQTERFRTLAQCPNGTFYTTAVGRQGETSLVQLDLAQGKAMTLAQLKFNGQDWNSGLRSLVCSPSGQLFALGAPRYVTPNNLYTVNPSDGAMTLLRAWDVNNITFSRA